MEILLESLRHDLEAMLRLLPRVVIALALLGTFIFAGRMIGRAVVRLLERREFTHTHRSFFRHLATWAFGLLGLSLALNVLGLQSVATGLLAGGGITAVALGFAFREIGENLLAGFFLAFSRPFELGDLIESQGFLGIVEGIALRSTHIRTADGRDVFIPSARIFNDPLVNYTRDGLRRPSVKVGIDYRDDGLKASEALLRAVREIDGVLQEPPPEVNLATLAPQYQELEVTFWVDVFAPGANMLATRTQVVDRCRRVLADGGFRFSSEVTTGIALESVPSIPVRLGSEQ